MTFVEKIEWLDKENKEASVTISDGDFSLICYVSSCDLIKNEKFNEKIYCLDVEYIYLINDDTYEVERPDYSCYGYILKGKLADIDNKIMLIGNIKIDLSTTHIPGDIFEDQFIEIKVPRLDIY